MKKVILRSLLALFLITGFTTISNAQRFYVKVQPAEPVVVRPAQPSPRHVWIEGDWTWQNGTYVHKDGYWTVPPAGRVWVAGHWSHEAGGYYWVAGHWRRA